MTTRRDSGVTVVEAAFVLPIMFLFLAAMIDLGMWTLNANQASNAARDGARAGILSYQEADVPGSADEAAVIEAMEARMDGRPIAPSDIEIECVEPDGDPVSGGCSAARVDIDRIRVDVNWIWPLVTPIAGVVGTQDGRAEGSATMAIVGRPLPPVSISTTSTTSTTSTSTTSTSTTSTTTPPLCIAAGVTASPSPIGTNGNSGKLSTSLTIVFVSTGACPNLAVELVAPGGVVVAHACGCGSAPSHTWIYGGQDKIWGPGTGTVRVLSGSDVVGTSTFIVS